MKTKLQLLVLLMVSLAAGRTLQAATTATIEDRKAFVKITDAQRPDVPANRDAPDILFIRKADILRISMVFAGRHTEYRVFLVIAGPEANRRTPDAPLPEVKVPTTDWSTTYTYTFPSEASATAFCEALLTK